MMADDTCPNAPNHTQAPKGYLQWSEWAEEMMKTHTSIVCDGCGRYSIWVPLAAGEGDAMKDGSIAGG